MTRREDQAEGAALPAALLLGVPALDLLVGGDPRLLHAVFALCGLGLGIPWLREVA